MLTSNTFGIFDLNLAISEEQQFMLVLTPSSGPTATYTQTRGFFSLVPQKTLPEKNVDLHTRNWVLTAYRVVGYSTALWRSDYEETSQT